jgi:N utilization substance protein B
MSGSRRKARNLALKGIYQWLLNRSDFDFILDCLSAESEYRRADQEYAKRILKSAMESSEEIFSAIEGYLDRPLSRVSPIEQAILLIANVELKKEFDVPSKVVINEAVELAKDFGGTDGHKYINGILDKIVNSNK